MASLGAAQTVMEAEWQTDQLGYYSRFWHRYIKIEPYTGGVNSFKSGLTHSESIL